ALPKDTDRQHFYYLERESRKMEEIAWSDEIMEKLSAAYGFPVEELRGGKLQLSQPAEAGWHFYADDKDPQTADGLASAWAAAQWNRPPRRAKRPTLRRESKNATPSGGG
ncbi:MAG: hypothetical protein LDL51_10165, partial [Chloroflexi bacterium]|nr:hypothetical protein [Chloroflexota bacterium]